MGTLQFLVEKFNSWDEAEKDSKCTSLYGLGADGAWEMRLMGPYETPIDNRDYFARFVPACGVPKYPCGRTVEFLGACLDTQVVNYVEWGAMNQLCNNQTIGMLAHIIRDRFFKLKWMGFEGPAFQAQDLMSHIGEDFARESTGLGERKKSLEALMRAGVQVRPEITKMDGFDCPLTCGKYMPNLDRLNGMDWGFKWGDDWYDRRGKDLAKP